MVTYRIRLCRSVRQETDVDVSLLRDDPSEAVSQAVYHVRNQNGLDGKWWNTERVITSPGPTGERDSVVKLDDSASVGARMTDSADHDREVEIRSLRSRNVELTNLLAEQRVLMAKIRKEHDEVRLLLEKVTADLAVIGGAE